MKQEQLGQLKRSIRCCVSCILPCGAFDVVRIVHSNGYVEELACTVRAADVIQSHPKHVLKKPSFDSTNHRPTAVDVPPDAILHRGKIYFLIPASPPLTSQSQSQRSDRKKTNKKQVAPRSSSSPSVCATSTARSSTVRRRQQSGSGGHKSICGRADVSDQYLSEILSEKVVSMGSRDRRRGRVGVWRPHLESITETL
uniref:Uncharacterized protein n=1 Tax=Opuntia streptacantha TaxID=393608 RepID=A0A7C9D8X0_OPUST